MTTAILPQLQLVPLRKRARAGHAQTLDVLVALQAPMREQTGSRPTLNLAVVIDNSGSMQGHPLDHAKRAAAALVHGLQPDDRVSIVTYADSARVVLASMPADQAKVQVDRVLAAVQTEGCTALHAGWLAGAEQVAPFVSQYGISRVLLLSDGNANVGEQRPDALRDAGRKLAAAGITTSTYGIGSHFNETLMAACAQAGQGIAVYAQDADGLATYFANEFAMLCDLAGKDVRLAMTVKGGKGKPMQPQCLNDLETVDGQVRLPALLSGAESWAVFSIDLDEKQARGQLALEACVQFVDQDGQAHTLTAQEKVAFGERAGAADKRVAERAKEARAAQVAKQAREAAIAGDFGRRDHLIRSMAGMAQGNAYVAAVAQNLADVAASGNAALFAKEALYSSTTMTSRVADQGEDHTVLSAGRYGLRKAMQGRAVKGEDDRDDDQTEAA